MSAEELEKDVQVEDVPAKRRVVVTMSGDAVNEMVRREVGAPEGIRMDMRPNADGGISVVWEVPLHG